MRPLEGRRILVTRPRAQALGFCEQLAAAGARPVLFPTVAIVPLAHTPALEAAIAALRAEEYGWAIFTSANGVNTFMDQLGADEDGRRALGSTRLAAIGPATARALRERTGESVWTPSRYLSEGILAELQVVAGQRILLPRSQGARPELADGLRRAGAKLDELQLYRAVPSRPNAAGWRDMRRDLDAITFTSPSTVNGFVSLVGVESSADPIRRSAVVCIGPVTAEAADRAGLPVNAVADEHTSAGLVRALIEYFEEEA